MRVLLLFLLLLSSAASAQSGKVLRLDGTSGYASLQGPLPDLTEMTIELWVLFRPADVSASSVIYMDGTPGWANDVILNMTSGTIGICANKSMSWLNHENNRLPVGRDLRGRWHHLAWVMAPGHSTLYVDSGVIAQLDERGSNVGGHALRPSLGRGDDERGNPWQYFPGCMDEFRIWSRTLTAAEVTRAMTAASQDTAGLVLWYDFEGEGDVVDRSGHGYGASLVGGAERADVAAVPVEPPVPADSVVTIGTVLPAAQSPLPAAVGPGAPAGPVPALVTPPPAEAVRIDSAAIPPGAWSSPFAQNPEGLLALPFDQVATAVAAGLGGSVQSLRLLAATAAGALYLAAQTPAAEILGARTLQVYVWRSTDRGRTWELLLHQATGNACRYDQQVRAATLHPDGRVFLGTADGLYLDDRKVVVPPQATDVAALHVSPDGRYLFVATNELTTLCEWPTNTYSVQGLYRARLDGDSLAWDDLTDRQVLSIPPIARVGCDPADPEVVYFGSHAGWYRARAATAAQMGWRQVAEADLPPYLAYQGTLADPRPFLRVQQGYAANWTPRSPIDMRYGWGGLAAGWEGFIYAPYRGEYSHLVEEGYLGSRDGGVTWTGAGGRGGFTGADLDPMVWAADARGVVQLSASALTGKEGSGGSPWNVDPLDPLCLYAAMRGRGVVYVSPNRGGWERRGQGLPPTLTVAGLGVDSLGVLYVRTASQALARRVAERVVRVARVQVDSLLSRGQTAVATAHLVPWPPPAVSLPAGLEVRLLPFDAGSWREMRDDGVAPDRAAGDGTWTASFVVGADQAFGCDGVIVAAQVRDRPSTRASQRQGYRVVPADAHEIYTDAPGPGWRCVDGNSADTTSTERALKGQRSLRVLGEVTCAWQGEGLHPYGRTLDLWAYSEGAGARLTIEDVPAAAVPALAAGVWTHLVVPAELLYAEPTRAGYGDRPSPALIGALHFRATSPVWLDEVCLTVLQGSPATVVAEAQPELRPIGLRLLPAFPNPANGGVVVPFRLPAAVAVQLEVYDALGQRVRVLVDGEVLPAGEHRVLWDGRDTGGRTLASGVYLVRLRTAGMPPQTGRVVLVR
ncbi:MAG: LamG-like jellyroll fold domain-containing protein [Candidatus Latescibacterota bacterium]|jgi:hypothetical protein